jgi:hypothetical protein
MASSVKANTISDTKARSAIQEETLQKANPQTLTKSRKKNPTPPSRALMLSALLEGAPDAD